MSAVKPVLDAFATTAWKAIEDVFNSLKTVLDPIKEIFKPFEPLQELLHREIELPWFQPPYPMTNYG